MNTKVRFGFNFDGRFLGIVRVLGEYFLYVIFLCYIGGD